jgi:mannosyltransferase OCH1-like enzyme
MKKYRKITIYVVVIIILLVFAFHGRNGDCDNSKKKLDGVLPGPIPLIIHQKMIFKRDKIPERMKKAMSSFVILNSDYNIRYYDDDDERNFFINKYGENSSQLYTYDHLIPRSYKSDFFRHCLLYEYGGVWVDTDMIGYIPFGQIFNKDSNFIISTDYGVQRAYNGFFASVPKHPILYFAIRFIEYNVKHKIIPMVPRYDKGHADLAITGPILFHKAINHYLKNPEDALLSQEQLKTHSIQLLFACANKGNISVNRDCEGPFLLSTKYKGYKEDISHLPNSNYGELFRHGKIYKS